MRNSATTTLYFIFVNLLSLVSGRLNLIFGLCCSATEAANQGVVEAHNIMRHNQMGTQSIVSNVRMRARQSIFEVVSLIGTLSYAFLPNQ